MKQHNYQRARLKLFEDKRINKIWLFSKSGGRPFPVPASKVTAEMDFQKPHLELFQAKIEKRAARAFQKEGKWEPKDYEAIIEWTVLHLIRNRKSRREFFASAEDYNNRFISEFYKEVTISHDRYPNIDIHESKEDRFLVTADHPVA